MQDHLQLPEPPSECSCGQHQTVALDPCLMKRTTAMERLGFTARRQPRRPAATVFIALCIVFAAPGGQPNLNVHIEIGSTVTYGHPVDPELKGTDSHSNYGQ